MPWDVFEKQEFGFNFTADSSDVGPKVSRIEFATSLTRHGERLAGVAANDAIHDSTPRAAVEGSEIRPHRRVIQGIRLHLFHQCRDRERFDLHITDRSSIGKSQVDSKVEAGSSGAEAEDFEGT